MAAKLTKNGRKYRMTQLGILVLLVGFGASTLNPVLATLYPQLVTGVLGLIVIYHGGNVGNKWVVGKTNPSSEEEPK